MAKLRVFSYLFRHGTSFLPPIFMTNPFHWLCNLIDIAELLLFDLCAFENSAFYVKPLIQICFCQFTGARNFALICFDFHRQANKFVWFFFYHWPKNLVKFFWVPCEWGKLWFSSRATSGKILWFVLIWFCFIPSFASWTSLITKTKS